MWEKWRITGRDVMGLKKWELASHKETGSVGSGKLYSFPKDKCSTSLLSELMSFLSELNAI